MAMTAEWSTCGWYS